MVNLEKNDMEKVIEFFIELSKYPRASGKEHAVCRWLYEYADTHEFNFTELPVKEGYAPNILITVPPTGGCEEAPGVCLQAHMDMVCQKTPLSKHNFDTDPIEPIFEDGWIHAGETTLGADNGIGMAMAMAAALTRPHPMLELLFTVDEEGGLGGATALPAGILKSHYLINLDSEDEGFIIGCAGGQRFEITNVCRLEQQPQRSSALSIKINGLIGGHSGVDIDKNRSNAIKICGKLLDMINSCHGLLISSLYGGTQTTAIARDVEAQISTPASKEQVEAIADELCDILKNENPQDAGLQITIKETPAKTVCCGEDTAAIITLLHTIDCGPVSYCKDYPHIVETSTSIGTIRFDAAGTNREFSLAGCERSSQLAGIEMVSERNRRAAENLGMNYIPSAGYRPWPPRPTSKLLKICSDVYRRLNSKEPVVEIVHAGLECGVIGEKYPGLDMISFGPLIENAHSPQERVNIESLENNYRLLLGILKELSQH
jgi:dipeptidase D